MTSAIVNVFDDKQKKIRARVLLDTCSTANFVTDNFVKKLKLPKHDYNISIGALDNLTTSVKNIVKITFQSIHNDYKRTLHFLVVPCISDLVPNQAIPREQLKIPKNIRLADPNFHKPAPVDMLINTGTTLSLFSLGSINLSTGKNDLYLQKTKLGWILGGNLDCIYNKNSDKISHCMLTELKELIEKFWSVEELKNKRVFSSEETECEKHFTKHINRDENGRYIVALPFKHSPKILGESRQTALSRLSSLRRKFKNDPEYQLQYDSVLSEYLMLNHMSLIKSPSITEGFYLPHHGVYKDSSSTTKLRVVFDASAKSSSGVSLNDILMVGPTIQDDLFTLIIRFRFYVYVLLADIEKMYRQFLVREEDRVFQKILWESNGVVNEYVSNTVTFGTASAAFLAIRCLIQLTIDEGDKFPLAAKILKNDMYVDNMITGTNSIDEAREIYQQMTKFLKLAQLNMRQWVSNNCSILDGVDERSLDNDFKINKDCISKALGIYWKAREDSFVYSIRTPNTERVTKRIILSEIAKLFDPLGLIGPVILYAKRIMQELWQAKVDWDESVPTSIYCNWIKFCEQLKSLENATFARMVLIKNTKNIEIHGFSDASEKGYGACLYVRSDDGNGKYHCSLLCAKSRVAPLKKLTIPKLELNGATLLVDLFEKITSSINVKINSTYFWTDSEIVLHWIRVNPNLLKTFESNRVSTIQNKTDLNQWKHVRSHDNPADGLSRGQLPDEFLKNKLWFNGPEWLSQEMSSWPKSTFQPKINSLPGLKIVNCMSLEVKSDILNLYSSFPKLQRIIALCFRFLPKYKHYKGRLKLAELNHSEHVIIQLIQKSHFQQEISSLKNKQVIDKNSKFYKLDPFLDQNNILRVGGRLRNSNLSFTRQHPILLPKSHFLTKMIIIYYHKMYAHAGVQATLYAIRQKYWLVDGRTQIRSVVRECITCFRVRPKLADYKMGDLPSVRVVQARPFIHVGVDYCGPFYIKERKYKNRNKLKIYVAVFICMSVKAIHIEVVSDLTTDGFLGALRRFISRRGKPNKIYCDNATNFKGAKNNLKELYETIQTSEFQNRIISFSHDREIEFHFIPPSSPHFGGLWEAGVKSYKHHFKRVASNASFTFEEFNTLSIEIESILNSRPLTPMSSDVNDLCALTPGHFLIGDSLMSIPEPNYLPLSSNRLSAWQHVSKVRQDFWKRWNLEYLNELNIRKKWNKNTSNPKEGMLVLIKVDDIPCMQWPLARIKRVHLGKDGIVRSVTVKTANNELERTVRKIAILPLHNVNDE